MSGICNPSFRLVLASGSGTRRRLLQAAGLAFDVIAPDVDERALDADPLGLARAKALNVKAPGALVIGADQVLMCEGRVLHKSPTRAAAALHLAQLSGRTHSLTSAFAIARDGEILVTGVETARMTVRPLTPEAIGLYLDAAGPDVLGSVGAYHWEGLGMHLFERVEGDQSTILGLPMLKLLAALREIGAGLLEIGDRLVKSAAFCGIIHCPVDHGFGDGG